MAGLILDIMPVLSASDRLEANAEQLYHFISKDMDLKKSLSHLNKINNFFI